MKQYRFPLLAVVSVGLFVFYRAAHLPITHDEASTWLNYRHLNLWSCLNEYFCWQTANNHWLNSLLLQGSASLFGDAPWALRMPNCLAGMLYALAASLICMRYLTTPVIRVAGFLLLTCHIYLLDFFSLARGYGLLACSVMWAIWCLIRYTETYSLKWLGGCIMALVLGVISNFTGLLAFASFGGAWLVVLIISNKWSLIWRHGILWLVISIGLYFLLSYPIRMLMGNGEFAWGAPDFGEMIRDLFRNLLYGATYFGNKTVISILAFVLLSVTGVAVYWSIQKRKPLPVMGVSILLLLITLLAIETEHRLLGSNLPVGRKSIFLIPLLFLPLALGLNFIWSKTSALVMTGVISIALLFHLRFSYPWGAVREWYFDAYYPQLFAEMRQPSTPQDSIRLGSSWLFNPALQYYRSAQSMPLAGLVYQKKLVIDTTMEFYIVESPDSVKMHENGFSLVKSIGPCLVFKNTNPLIARDNQ